MKAVFLLALALIAKPDDAQAQACCAGGSATSPMRLMPLEVAGVGVRLRGAEATHRFDSRGNLVDHGTEREVELAALAGVRVTRRAQVSLLVPWLLNYRASSSVSSTGTWIGDVGFQSRYDFTLAHEYHNVPGIAALAGASFPTGRAPEDARKPLGVDATGSGRFQGSLGVGLEHGIGPVFGSLTLIGQLSTSRQVGPNRSTLGPQGTALLAGGYAREDGIVIAVFYSQMVMGPAKLNGTEMGGARALGTLGTTLLLPIAKQNRLLLTGYWDLPIRYVGRSQLGLVGVTVTGVHTWL